MSYRTLLAVHPTDEPLRHLAPVVALAHAFDAHVDVLIVSALTPVPTMIAAQAPDRVWNQSLAELASRCEQRAEQVRDYFNAEGVGLSVDIQAQQIALLDKAIAAAAVTTDLVLLHRSESLVSGVSGHALEGSLFDAGKPVLVLGRTDPVAPIDPEQVLIAWDGSREAAHAVQYSLPLLRKARSIQAFAIEENGKRDLRQSLKALSRQLSRHGIALATRSVPRDGQLTGHALVQYVVEHNPSLLVMGAYGHARLREFVFSGATRAVLTHEMDNTLLLAH